MSNDTQDLSAAEGARHFDAIIIGAGQAGPSLAGRMNAAGLSVAIIERHLARIMHHGRRA